ncbi:hypothetical protein [Pontibacter akesuensis]|uniref:Uncharacterized protein n=1 Tax=Pontibacter akesuensis TaxID=388950 RepID=A0A1I7FL49_9BACT|nr:hypothetical protein [Pontibacter akesuensis]GHA61706.1 hypothetical protein GCM10007389_12790 [Pontibacter akesuensis]SFU36766.1 hypothetical protein SAMN04487941_0280 [Pontibacter akesuensis]
MKKGKAKLLAIAGTIILVSSCGTPSDLRPEDKVSVEYVEPGTRSTYNIGKVNEVHPPSDEGEVMPDRDLGGNHMVQPNDSIKETTETNTVLGTTKE